MSERFEKTIQCKNTGPEGDLCAIEIGLSAGKWYDVKSGIIHSKTCKYPRVFKRRSTFPAKEMEENATFAEIRDLKEKFESIVQTQAEQSKDIENIKEILQAHTKELDFKKGNTV
jgi:hypothetical protein